MPTSIRSAAFLRQPAARLVQHVVEDDDDDDDDADCETLERGQAGVEDHAVVYLQDEHWHREREQVDEQRHDQDLAVDRPQRLGVVAKPVRGGASHRGVHLPPCTGVPQ